MIAYVPHQAAFDDRLGIVAHRLLIYLGSPDLHRACPLGTWCWETVEDIVASFSMHGYYCDADVIDNALQQLYLCRYIERGTIAVLQHYYEEDEEHVRKVYRTCYRVIVTLDE